MILILLLGGMETYKRFKARNTPESKAFHDIPRSTRIGVAVVYLGLAALLALRHVGDLPRARLRRRLSG